VILQRVLTHPLEEAEGFRDRRLKLRKLNNWRKRYRDELRLGTSALGSADGRIQGEYLLRLNVEDSANYYLQPLLFLVRHP